MANASVEKLKALGIRHGEKAVVGLTGALCLVFIALAIIRPTMEMKPEELSTSASNANANLQKQQPEPDVLAKLEKDGLVDPNFVKIVDDQLKNSLKPDGYRPKMDWVTPEPGAGLIRDQPELIAPTEVAAFPGRGGILLFALDEKGERIIDTGADAKGKKKSSPSKKSRKEEKPEDKKRREDAEEKRKELFAGKTEPEKDKEKKDDGAPDAPQGPWKEETRGKRWVVLTGLIHNEQLKKNYLLALKNPAIAYPNYKRLDVERRALQYDGTWTEWAATDQDKNYAVLDNLPELDTEFVPEPQRPKALVDPLPFLRAGYWAGVHVAKLVPPEVLEGPKNKAGGPGNVASGDMMGGGESRMSGGESRMGGGSMAPASGAQSGGESRMGGGSVMGGMAAGGGGDPGESSFTKVDEKIVMLRSIDFTVEPDTTYQFRVRIVVVNPNHDHSDVNPGVDVESKELIGPWSDETDSVSLPADVAAYAHSPEAASRRDDLVNFQVIRWDPASGQTLVKNDAAGPGELVGEFGTIQMPSSEGGGPKPTAIDFNSRAIIVDTLGGNERLPDIGVERNPFTVPAIAMVVEPDGTVVVRSQARDNADDVREDMKDGYDQAIRDSGKTRKPGSGSKVRGPGGKKKKKRR